MSREKMEKVTFGCGHEGYIYYMNSKQRSEKEEWAKTEDCPKCCKASRRAENLKKAEQAKKEVGLPDLTGSEAQIKWAETIRADALKQIQLRSDELEKAKKCFESQKDFHSNEEVAMAKSNIEKLQQVHDCAWEMLSTAVDSRFWIDNREWNYGLKNVNTQLKGLVDSYLAFYARKEEKASGIVDKVKEETTLLPQEVQHSGVVEISVSGDTVSARYQKDEDFRQILRYQLGYRWNGDDRCWQRVCDKFSGTAADRAAETINALLTAGFKVICSDNAIRRAAVDATYAAEQKRWVSWLVNSKVLALSWEHGNDALYSTARTLPDAHWDRDNGSIDVPLRNWREVLDFADLNGFSISSGAKEHINAAQEEVIGVVKVKETQKMPSQAEQLDAIMQDSTIPNDLKDD